MESALKQIWAWMGVPQVWGAVLTLLGSAIIYLLKKLIDQLIEKRKADREVVAEQFTDIAEYAKEQSVALTKAYLRIFESREATDAYGSRFAEIVERADNDVMTPVRAYEAKLDEETRIKIFSVHNILAQYYPEASDQAVAAFKARKVEFYAKIEDAQRFLRPDLILYRLGITSQVLRKRKGIRQ
jgi:hypothetical protein